MQKRVLTETYRASELCQTWLTLTILDSTNGLMCPKSFR